MGLLACLRGPSGGAFAGTLKRVKTAQNTVLQENEIVNTIFRCFWLFWLKRGVSELRPAPGVPVDDRFRWGLGPVLSPCAQDCAKVLFWPKVVFLAQKWCFGLFWLFCAPAK